MTAARIGGGLLGAAGAVALLFAAQPEGAESVGAEVSFSAAQTGELLLEPPGPEPFLSATLKPGESTGTGSLRLTNQTGSAMRVSPRVLPSTHALDESLVVALTSGGRELGRAPVGALDAKPISLPPGGGAELAASATLASDAGPGWEAELVDLALVFDRVR